MAGDNIYNGADDNATGCGVLIELARAFARAPARPGVPFFAAVTAEGKVCWAQSILATSAHTSRKNHARLELRRPPPLGSPDEVEVSGAERTMFYPVVEELAKDFHLSVRPDARPEAATIIALDHFRPGARRHSCVLGK